MTLMRKLRAQIRVLLQDSNGVYSTGSCVKTEMLNYVTYFNICGSEHHAL